MHVAAQRSSLATMIRALCFFATRSAVASCGLRSSASTPSAAQCSAMEVAAGAPVWALRLVVIACWAGTSQALTLFLSSQKPRCLDADIGRALVLVRVARTQCSRKLATMPSNIMNPNPEHDDIMYPQVLPFLMVHAGCFAVIWSGISWRSVAICVVLYAVRMFAIGAGYHRYFSHRAYSTSRVFQFVLAFLAQSSAQKSILWWAAKHRHHHLHSDTEQDVHSPRHRGFFYSHVSWIFYRQHDATDLVKISDFASYPELIWLHRFELLPAFLTAGFSLLLAGLPGLVVGFLWSTVLLYHATFCINSLAHLHGRKRYVTGDDSRNNWLLALFTMGEGWHNNHHAYQSSARQGFRWWEIDATYYVLTILRWLGIVWDLKTPPQEVLSNEQPLGSRALRRTAEQLAGKFNPQDIAVAVRLSLQEGELLTRDALFLLRHPSEYRLPCMPTREQMLAEGKKMFAKTTSLDAIVDRAHNVLIESVGSLLRVRTRPPVDASKAE
jgi:stearoyl-CoA desaturase (Delta-9 desaturase)